LPDALLTALQVVAAFDLYLLGFVVEKRLNQHFLDGRLIFDDSNYFHANKMAEREGFEPPEPFGSIVFKTTAFGHSAISPEA
jgi:hypothetical protein